MLHKKFPQFSRLSDLLEIILLISGLPELMFWFFKKLDFFKRHNSGIFLHTVLLKFPRMEIQHLMSTDAD